MKKLGIVLFSFALLIGIFPQSTKAALNPKFEQDLSQYLQEVSKVRGFEVTKEDIETSLSYYEESIENYESVEDLSSFLGEVIISDLSNLEVIYEEYELNEESLKQLLKDHDEELDDYIFLDDLSSAVEEVVERDPNFEQNLEKYLTTVSEERGFEVTKEHLEKSLAIYDTSLEEFKTVGRLSDFLGEAIKADLSNLDYFYENYELDQQALLQLLQENDDDINNYVYIDDVDNAVWRYYGDELVPETDGEIGADLLPIFKETLDLTEEELQRLEDHFMSLEEDFNNPETLKRLEELSIRMMAFEEFDVAAELTAEQIAELISIYEEFISLFKISVSYSLVKGSIEEPLSIFDLMNMKELKGANLKVDIFSNEGQFLADLIVTGEMVDSDIIVDTGDKMGESAEEVTNTVEQPTPVKPQKVMAQKKVDSKKVIGAKLPNTSTNHIQNILIGFILVLIGLLMYRKLKTV